MIDTIIFDLDGTLLDTLNDLYQSTNAVLTRMGFPTRTYQEIRKFVGNGMKTLLERALPESHKDQINEAYELFIPYYKQHQMDTTKAYPNIFELLEHLKQRKIKMAIVSNKIHHAVQEICQPLFGRYIDVMIGESPNLEKKPAPDMLFEALKRLNSKIENTWFIGDGETDVATANNAGVKVCAVTWGFRDKAYLETLKIDAIIDNPMELLNII